MSHVETMQTYAEVSVRCRLSLLLFAEVHLLHLGKSQLGLLGVSQRTQPRLCALAEKQLRHCLFGFEPARPCHLRLEVAKLSEEGQTGLRWEVFGQLT